VLLLGLVLGAVGCGAAPPFELPPADPRLERSAGLMAPVRWLLDGLLETSAALELHSGSVAMFAHRGRVVHATAAGYADLASQRPMTLETRFRLASMTKPVTAVAALKLVEEGRLDLDDPVARYIPAAAGLVVATSRQRNGDGSIPTQPLSVPLTVRHLVTFTAGIGSEEDESDLGRLWSERNIYHGPGSLEDRVNRLLTAPLYEKPGRVWRYGWSADVLARVVEVASDMPLDDYLESRIFAPLAMEATSFLPPEQERQELATMYTQDEAGQLVLVETPSSDAPDWTPGGSGLVSTAGDFMRFALMLWNGGSYDGARVLSPESVAAMTRAHVTSGVLREWDIEGIGWGFGVAVVLDEEVTPMVDRTGDFWWTGFYGTHFFVSPESDLVGIVLTQNQPGPHSPLPYPIYVAPAIAQYGL